MLKIEEIPSMKTLCYYAQSSKHAVSFHQVFFTGTRTWKSLAFHYAPGTKSLFSGTWMSLFIQRIREWIAVYYIYNISHYSVQNFWLTFGCMLVNWLKTSTVPEVIPCQARKFHDKKTMSVVPIMPSILYYVTHSFMALNDQNNGFGGRPDKDKIYSCQN